MKKIFALAIGLTSFNINAAEDWKGCYFGLSASFADSSNQWTTTFIDAAAFNENAGSADGDDTAVGVQMGCDFVVSEDWVFGAKLAATDNTLTASHVYVGGTGPDNVISYKTDDMISLIGRIGFKAWENGLIYANLGYAQTSNLYEDNDPSPPVIAFSKSSNRDGFLAGVGYEHKISNGFSLFAEYNHVDFGKKNILLIDTVGFGVNDYQARVDQDITQFNVGVNYQF